MKSITVKNQEELKAALLEKPDEIIIENIDLITKLRAISLIRKAGPVAIAAIAAAIPLIPFTGGASVPSALVGFMGISAASTSAGLLALCIAIGGIVVIGIFTDWEEVEVGNVFTLRRKKK